MCLWSRLWLVPLSLLRRLLSLGGVSFLPLRQFSLLLGAKILQVAERTLVHFSIVRWTPQLVFLLKHHRPHSFHRECVSTDSGQCYSGFLQRVRTEGLCSQASVIELSVKSFTDLNCSLDSCSITVLARREARTAACSSNQGTLNCFKGATRESDLVLVTICSLEDVRTSSKGIL